VRPYRDRGRYRVIDGAKTSFAKTSFAKTSFAKTSFAKTSFAKRTPMRITLVGSRHFGVTTFNMLREHGVDIVRVVVADAEDRLAAAARAADIEVVVQGDPKLVKATEIAPGTDLIVTAHSHARVSKEALAAAKMGGIGYHPSLLPRHRGIAAVEWTIKEGDPIAGGSVYHLAERMDAGAIAAQDWVFVKKGETARELWERALAPLGQKLLAEVIDYAKVHHALPAKAQDEQFATKAPALS
jgi:methionyl-tRNA formyltransferase